MNVTVVIPYRGDGAHRDRAYTHTRAHLTALLPDAEIVAADSGHAPFNRAASRNEGVRQARGDVVVVCDADSLPEPEPLHAAINAAPTGGVHLPYTFFRALTREHTERVLHDGAPPRAAKPLYYSTTSVGGCYVATRDTWWAAGGQDERFHGWGYEDTAFAWAAECLVGLHRHHGVLYGLWHPPAADPTSEEMRPKRVRSMQYRAARRDPEAMRELIWG